MFTFYEFFAGGGMARAGLGQEWRCLFANDLDEKKCETYRRNWGSRELLTANVGSLSVEDIPGRADLAWASFPCQDLSLAGCGAGLKGDRSGTFRPFWNLMKSLVQDNRAPRLIALENVCGALTSHDGKDFATICKGFRDIGYSVGAMVVDATLFVPQSRPRLFIIGAHEETSLPQYLHSAVPSSPWHSRALVTAYEKLPAATKDAWVWWNLPAPPRLNIRLSDLVEKNPPAASWFSVEETEKLLSMMSAINRGKVEKARQFSRRVVGAVYKRTRPDENGKKAQRAEIRFDGISGCLRTPAGGSSRQVIVIVNGPLLKARLITSRETARLMGLPDDYVLPSNYNEAYYLTGDGVVVPVVRHLAKHIFEPVLNSVQPKSIVAA